MATREQIRDAMHSQPFRAFTVHLVDGRSYTVKHPDFISIPSIPRGRDVVVHDDTGLHLIDMGLVVEIQIPHAVEASPTSNP